MAEWNCAACTFRNNKLLEKCEICGTDRPHQPTAAPANNPFSSAPTTAPQAAAFRLRPNSCEGATSAIIQQHCDKLLHSSLVQLATHPDENQFQEAISVLKRISENILSKPDQLKFRQLFTTNKTVNKVTAVPGGHRALVELANFQHDKQAQLLQLDGSLDGLRELISQLPGCATARSHCNRLLDPRRGRPEAPTPKSRAPALVECCTSSTNASAKLHTVQLLLQLKADPQGADSTGRSALYAACAGQSSPSVVALLLSAGATISEERHAPPNNPKAHRNVIHALCGGSNTAAATVLPVLLEASPSLVRQLARQATGKGQSIMSLTCSRQVYPIQSN